MSELGKMTNSGKSKRYLFLIYVTFWGEKFICFIHSSFYEVAATTLIEALTAYAVLTKEEFSHLMYFYCHVSSTLFNIVGKDE